MTTSTAEGATADCAILNLYVSIVIHKTALAATKDRAINIGTSCDGHIGLGGQG